MNPGPLFALSIAAVCLCCDPAEATKVAIRCVVWYGNDMRAAGPSAYPVCFEQVDMGYGAQEMGLFKTKTVFPEYYIGWEEGAMDPNAATNPFVQLIRRAESRGFIFYGVKISRESCGHMRTPPFNLSSMVSMPIRHASFQATWRACTVTGLRIKPMKTAGR